MLARGWQRWTIAAAIAGAVCAGASGCGWGGDVSEQREQRLEDNLARQKEAARVFIENQPNVDAIRFTHEGDRPGLGAPWSVNAVVTIDGTEYQEILGLTPWSFGGDPMPSTEPTMTPGQVTVIYSDGTSEVLG